MLRTEQEAKHSDESFVQINLMNEDRHYITNRVTVEISINHSI